MQIEILILLRRASIRTCSAEAAIQKGLLKRFCLLNRTLLRFCLLFFLLLRFVLQGSYIRIYSAVTGCDLLDSHLVGYVI